MSLRLKFLLSILVVSIITVGAFTITAFGSLNKLVLDTTIPSQQRITSHALDEIDLIVNERIKELKVGASNSKIVEATRNLSTQESMKIEMEELRNFAKATGPWDKVSLVDLELNTLTHSDVNNNKSGHNTIKLDDESESVFSQVAGGATLIADDISFSGSPTIDIYIPIRDRNSAGNPVVGVLYGELSWPLIEEALRASEEKYFLLNNKQKVIAVSKSFEGEYLEQYKFTEEIRADAVKKQGYSLVDLPNNDKLIVVYANQKGHMDFNGLGWTLVSEVSLNNLSSVAADNLRRLILLIIPLFLIAISTLVYFVEKMVIKPVFDLTNLTEKLADGDFSIKANEGPNDEMGLLAKSFNKMTTTINENQSRMKSEVEARTKELESLLAETKDSRNILEKQTTELESKTKQLEKMNSFMVNRELKMIELKNASKKPSTEEGK